jgi:hypothetical protein
LKKIKSLILKYIYFVDVDGLSYVCKMVEMHHKTKSATSLLFILDFWKNWIRFIMISKIKTLKFSNKFDVGIIRISFKFILIWKVLFSLKFVISIFWQIFCCLHFFWICIIFLKFFPNKNCQIQKNSKQKKHVGCFGVRGTWGGGGGGGG